MGRSVGLSIGIVLMAPFHRCQVEYLETMRRSVLRHLYRVRIERGKAAD